MPLMSPKLTNILFFELGQKIRYEAISSLLLVLFSIAMR